MNHMHFWLSKISKSWRTATCHQTSCQNKSLLLKVICLLKVCYRPGLDYHCFIPYSSLKNCDVNKYRKARKKSMCVIHRTKQNGSWQHKQCSFSHPAYWMHYCWSSVDVGKFTESMEHQRNGWLEAWGFIPVGFKHRATRERETEGRNRKRNLLTQLPLQKHEEGGQDHEGWKGTERPRVSLCVAVWNGLWKTGMLCPSCAPCHGTVVRLRGTLPPGPLGYTNLQPDRVFREFCIYLMMMTQNSPLTSKYYWINWVGMASLVFHKQEHVTSVLLVWHHIAVTAPCKTPAE